MENPLVKKVTAESGVKKFIIPAELPDLKKSAIVIG